MKIFTRLIVLSWEPCIHKCCNNGQMHWSENVIVLSWEPCILCMQILKCEWQCARWCQLHSMLSPQPPDIVAKIWTLSVYINPMLVFFWHSCCTCFHPHLLYHVATLHCCISFLPIKATSLGTSIVLQGASLPDSVWHVCSFKLRRPWLGWVFKSIACMFFWYLDMFSLKVAPKSLVHIHLQVVLSQSISLRDRHGGTSHKWKISSKI